MATARWSLIGLLTVAVLAGVPARAADPALCAAIADPAARLICYDAALKPAPGTAPATAPAPAAATAPKPAATPAPATAPARAAAPAAAAPVVAAPAKAAAAPAAEPEKRSGLSSMFGLLPKREKKAREQLRASVTDIVVRSNGQLVTLDNEQVWLITEPQRDAFVEPDDEVVIDPASLGSFLMSRASGGGSVRVKRVK